MPLLEPDKPASGVSLKPVVVGRDLPAVCSQGFPWGREEGLAPPSLPRSIPEPEAVIRAVVWSDSLSRGCPRMGSTARAMGRRGKYPRWVPLLQFPLGDSCRFWLKAPLRAVPVIPPEVRTYSGSFIDYFYGSLTSRLVAWGSPRRLVQRGYL